MRTLPQAMSDIITEGEFTGENKAVTRVVIYRQPTPGQYTVKGKARTVLGHTLAAEPDQIYTSLLFRNLLTYGTEMPNVKSVNWERSVDGDIASCTVECFNTKPLPPGTGPDAGESFDLLGYYTYNRGRTSYSQTSWGHAANEWRDMLVPDAMVVTYQGYGEPDYSVVPELDPSVVRTGVWLIDEVAYTADGLITLSMRDSARLLADQISFPPVVPQPHYPQRYSTYREVQLPDTTSDEATGWYRPTYSHDSVVPYHYHYKGGVVFGHHARDAFDGNPNTYWLSVGNYAPNGSYSKEFIEAKPNSTVKAVRGHVWGGPYRVWCSISVNGVWQGQRKINYYRPNNTQIDNGAGIPYLAEGTITRDGTVTFHFADEYENVDRVRITFGDLFNSGLGDPYKYRAGLRTFEISGESPVTVPGAEVTEGNYGDYSELVKRFLAWGGFYWPKTKQTITGTQKGLVKHSTNYSYTTDDPFLIEGRIWGDIEMSGTAGKAEGGDLGVEIWDKKPLLDCITYVKDMIGFIFFVDEHGAANFRSPNTYRLGNWLNDPSGLNLTRTTNYVTIRDDEAILGLRAVLSSRNIRNHIFVANVNGKIGAVVDGRAPGGAFRRVGGWTDQNFLETEECQRMADLIGLRQLFTYRQNTIRIPANPQIQIDDQIKILERTTGESYFHYVKSISSSWDQESGQWIYDLTTAWLGDSPSGLWAFDPNTLSQATKTYLEALGQL